VAVRSWAWPTGGFRRRGVRASTCGADHLWARRHTVIGAKLLDPDVAVGTAAEGDLLPLAPVEDSVGLVSAACSNGVTGANAREREVDRVGPLERATQPGEYSRRSDDGRGAWGISIGRNEMGTRWLTG
jgi:hypothetical protein